MFSKCANSLLAGNIICPVTDPRSYDFLSNEDNFRDMSDYFARIERAVLSPSAGGSFLLTYATRDNSEEQSRLKDLRKRYVREIDPVIKFVELVLRVEGADNMLQPGEDVQVGKIAAVVGQSQALAQELQSVVLAMATGARSDTNITSRIQGVLNRLEQWGYLKLVDKDREIYRVTGKLDVFYELIAFLRENIPGAKDEDEALEQQEMLQL